MKKYIKADIEDPRVDAAIVDLLIKAIENGEMRGFSEWNTFAWLSGYFGTEPQNLTKILNSIDYVFYSCPNIKNAEYLNPLEED